MSVDPKYVEEVKDEENAFDYNAILEEFGAEAEFVEDESGINIPTDYWSRNLSQLPENAIFAGKPFLGIPEKIEFEDKETGKKEINYRVKFVVIDDPSQEAYIISINLKSTDTVQKKVFPSSNLYALQMGLMELKAPGISRTYNRLTVDLDKLRKILENMEDIYFKVITVDGGNIGQYKSFRIVSEDTIE